MATEHFERSDENRQGWWQKNEDGQPIPRYRDSCGRGYKTKLWAAHHILPETSIKQSTENVKDKELLLDVQWITPWNINNEGNMIGLPHVFAYQFFYDNTFTFRSIVGKYPRWTAYLNNEYSRYIRKKWLEEIQKAGPEPYPIHIPTNWGHDIYNFKVRDDLEKRVWNLIKKKQKVHKVDPDKIEEALKLLEKKWYKKLTTRGEPTKSLWQKCTTDKNDAAALKPFTMIDVNKHPLFG